MFVHRLAIYIDTIPLHLCIIMKKSYITIFLMSEHVYFNVNSLTCPKSSHNASGYLELALQQVHVYIYQIM